MGTGRANNKVWRHNNNSHPKTEADDHLQSILLPLLACFLRLLFRNTPNWNTVFVSHVLVCFVPCVLHQCVVRVCFVPLVLHQCVVRVCFVPCVLLQCVVRVRNGGRCREMSVRACSLLAWLCAWLYLHACPPRGELKPC